MNLPKVATQLSDMLWFVQALNSGRYPYANSMLVDDRTKCMIDLGVGGSVLRELMNEVKIDEVVFSHCHEDHTAGCSFLPEAKFYAHRFDVDAIESVGKLKERYMVRGTDLEEPFDKFLFEALNLKVAA